MRYHKQQILHDPKKNRWGDCYRTAIACVLNLELCDVPHFCDNNNPQVNEDVEAWLNTRGLTRVTLGYMGGLEKVMECMKVWNPGLIYLMTGMSPRFNDTCHVVIAKDDKMIHDPHPDGTGLSGPDKDGVVWIEFFALTYIHKSKKDAE